MKKLYRFIQQSLFVFLLTFIFGSSLNAQTFITVGTGTTPQGYPFYTYYHDSKTQMIYTASEITAANGDAGTISSIAFDVTSVATQMMYGFTIQVQNTTMSSLTGFVTTGWTTVYSSAYSVTTTGWNTFNFSTPFVYDGTNLLVQICFDNTSYTSNSSVNTSSAPGLTWHYNTDGSSGCIMTGGSGQADRPNIKIGISMAPPTQTDLGLLAFTNPNFAGSITPSSSVSVGVQIVNTGLASQSNFPIKYSIDGGVNYITETYTNTINPGDTAVYTFTQNADLSISGMYPFVGVVALANDSNTNNDTIWEYAVACNPLSGTFTIGSDAADDFVGIQNAVAALNYCGVSGPVTFLIDPGTYNNKLILYEINGASATNTITFTSSTANASDVIISYNANDASDNHVVFLDGADYVKFMNVTIKALNYNYGTVVEVANGANYNTFYGNNIESIGDNSYSSGILDGTSLNNYNTYRKNSISYGYYGIQINSPSTSYRESGTLIDSNEIRDFSYYGLYIQNQDSFVVSNNYFHNENIYSYSSYGIYAYYCFNGFKILNNKIQLYANVSSYGLRLNYANYYSYYTGGAPGLVANNMISITDGTATSYGLYAYYSNDIMYYHNTVSISDNNAGSRALYQYNTTSNIYGESYVNNIFSNTSGGYAAYYGSTSSVATLDYNNYYATGANLAYWNGNYTNLATLQTASSKDAHSVSINPGFLSTTNLHTNSIILNNKGTYLSAVAYDIDGESRNATTPDIGADEFTPPANEISIIEYVGNTGSSCGVSSNEPISVVVSNNGTINQTNIPIKYKVDGGTVISGTIASLNSLSVDTFTFSTTANLSSAGIHTVQVFTDLTNDYNRDNDTVTAAVKSVLPIALPFYEGFENSNLYFNIINGENASARRDTNNSGNTTQDGLLMEGNDYNGWNYSGYDFNQNLINNSSHEVVVATCDIDGTNLTGLKLSFMLKQFYSSYDYNSWFWVTVNGDIVQSTLGDSIWMGWTTNGYEEIRYNLVNYIGGNIQIEFHGLLKNGQQNYDQNIITIDDIRIYQPMPNDVGVMNITASSTSECGQVNDSVFVQIINYGTLPQSNFPVYMIGTYGPNSFNFSSVYTDTLLPEAIGYAYMGMLNTNENGQITFSAYTALSTDAAKANDTLSMDMYNEVYVTIPHIEEFNIDGSNWNYNGFYQVGSGYYGLSSGALIYEQYGGYGAQTPDIEAPIDIQNQNAYAYYRKRIGVVESNTFLKVDLKFLSLQSFADSINIVVAANCSDNFEKVFSVNLSNYSNFQSWQTEYISLSAFQGQNVQIGAYVYGTGSSYTFAIDNFGLLNAFTYSLGNDTTICSGESVVLNTGLSASNGYSFQWFGPGIGTSSTLPYLTVSSTGLYYVKVMDTLGLMVTDSINVLVNSKPVVSIVSPLDSIYCTNDVPVSLYGYPQNGTFTGGNMTGNVFEPMMASLGINQIIYSFTDANNCSNADTVSTIVASAPTVNITSSINSEYCENEAAVNLSATPSGGTFSGLGISGNTFDPSQAGLDAKMLLYSYTDANNCTNQDTVNTFVNALPTVLLTSQLSGSYCKDGATVNLSALPTGGSFSGTGVSANIFMTDSAIIGQNTIIYAYTDANNCSNSDTLTTMVYSLPTVNIITVLNSAYCQNEAAVNLTATPSGGTYFGMGINGNTFDPSQSGLGAKMLLYSYTDTNGCSNTDTINTTVNPVPTVLFTSQLNGAYCMDGTTVNLTGFPSGGIYTGTGVVGNTFNTDSAIIGQNTLIYTYTDANNCFSSDTMSTIVNALPSVTLSTFADVCESQNNVNLTGGLPVGGSFLGAAVNTSQSKFYPNVAGVGLSSITYQYTDINGCQNSASQSMRVLTSPQVSFSVPANICKMDTVQASFTGSVGPNANYTWAFDNANVISGSTSGPYDLSWNNAGVKAISLIVVDSSCTSQMVYNYINVLDAIAVSTLVGNDSACFGDSILLFANSGLGYSYQWMDTSGLITSITDTLSYYSANQTGSYFVEVTNEFGCSAISSNSNLTINSLITSDFTMPTVACKNDMVALSFTGLAGSGAQYNWNFDNGQIASGSNAGPYNIIWANAGIKTVSLEVEENLCLSSMTMHPINIESTPAQITALGSTSFCDGGNVTLSANAGPYSYEWFKNGVTTSNTQALYVANQAGTYTVKVTNNTTNCSNISDSVVVVVNTNDFNIAFTGSPTSFTLPPFNVNFTNQTANANAYYWMWSFGDGQTSTFVNPSIQYQYDGLYTVGVIAQNINTGCFDTLVKNDYITCSGGSANPCTLDPSFGNDGGHFVCPGDSVKLFANDHTTGISYQWLRDGILLSGAVDSVYYAKVTGLFQLMVSDATCSNFSQPFSLTQYTTTIPVILANGSIQPCTNDSMELYVNTSFSSYQWSNGKVTPNIYVNNSGSYIVTVTDNHGCNTPSLPYILNTSLLQAPEICIVGIDTATNHNRLVWERQDSSLVDAYNIYRESNVAGVYDLIGSQNFSTLSVFEDVNSNPAQRAYRYRITAVDTCGMETPPSTMHKTIHLTINAGLNGAWNLIWDGYKGFNFGSYRIYRGSDSTSLQLLTQIQSSLTSYTDLNPPAGNVYYQIEILSPHPCYPDSVLSKANTNYNTSRSNTTNSSLAQNTGIVQSSDNKLSMQLFPNPNKGTFELEISNSAQISQDYQLEVYSALGDLIYQESIKATAEYRKQMHFETLSKGMYIIRLKSKTSVLTSKFVIE